MKYIHSLRRSLQRNHLFEQAHDKNRLLEIIENNIETGFQIATLRGPLCAEPVEGLAYFVESLQVNMQTDNPAGCK